MGIKDALLGGKQKSSTQTNTVTDESSLVNSIQNNTATNTGVSTGTSTNTQSGTVANTGSTSSLFGSGGSFSQQGWQPAMRRLETSLLPNVDAYSRQYGQGQGLWTGSSLAGENSLVGQGQDTLIGAAGTYGDRSTNLNNTLQGFLDYDPNSYQNTASRKALADNIRAQFNETIRPAIEDQGTFSGQFGGNQQSIAMGAATAPLSRAMADAEVNLMNADRDRAMAAMGLAPSVMNTGFTEGAMLQNIGDQRTARAQLGLEDRISQFEAPRNNRLKSILEMQGVLQPLTGVASYGRNTNAGYNQGNNATSTTASQTGTGTTTGNTTNTATGQTTGSVAGTAHGVSNSNSTAQSKGGGGLLQAALGGAAMFMGAGGSFGNLFGGSGATTGAGTFAAQPIGYQQPDFNLGIPGYSTGY